jgi:hypothetical protein
MAGIALRTALWLTLGGWVGSWACFGLVVAPAAFSVLPTTELAGQLVGPVLGALHLYGLVAGLALAALARAMDRSRVLVIAPLLLAALCAFSHFWVSAELAEIRPLAFGPGGSVEIATRFGALHRLSMGIYLVISAATLALVFLHARADARAAVGLEIRSERVG